MELIKDAPARAHLRRELEAHLTRLGYSLARVKKIGPHDAEIARVNPVRGRMAYGATVLRADLKRPSCHQQLLFFSQRRTRRRSSIPFFVGVLETDRSALEALLEQLGIRDGVRGGHVQLVAISPPTTSRRAVAVSKARENTGSGRATARQTTSSRG